MKEKGFYHYKGVVFLPIKRKNDLYCIPVFRIS